jgi:predicted DCC family thiol-disulfide oxidoreductase YuxK
MTPDPVGSPISARYAILYDGHCRFCTTGARKLASWMRRGSTELVDFQQPGALARFPGLSYEACMERMYLVAPDGRFFGGAEAVARAVATLPVIGWVAFLYYVPGIRQLLDRLYRLIAANRYRIMGRAVAAGECEDGTCALHLKQRRV